ncbi:3-deoxy-D-manno-octulosonic acid transferase [Daejeonella oryzae]|uniref:3-deoxy-D-manno-octulosonic acid transferase n=1 Tax=Daejeonella oryzae TaxID=1122943 RepID=UPI000419E60E|nr:glycosyltransferase N-terminal domain-containing protein [Daejeonella oryzae]
MLLLYNLVIKFYNAAIWLASFTNPKAKAWITGRKNLLEIIKSQVKNRNPSVWFHFASLGEFEQGRSVIENLKNDYPDKKIIITFFSPSGYQIRNNYALADHVFYLPVDSKKNAKTFIDLINPEIAVFTKYEYWYYYFSELSHQNIPIYVISAIFRKEQPFFKWYGKLHKRMLACVSHFFVQNQQSLDLLQSLKIKNATLSGDTRFDRVYENSTSGKEISLIKSYCENRFTLIAGSTWPHDENLLADIVRQNPEWKYIIAPHEITEEKIRRIEGLFPKTIRLSKLPEIDQTAIPVLIIDNIGMLSSLYQYAQIAYIGGGFGAGIHNTLEAAAFGIPVIFGPNYKKFKEAHDLIKVGAAFSVNDSSQLIQVIEKLKNKTIRENSGLRAKEYVQNQTGATRIILNHIYHNEPNFKAV